MKRLTAATLALVFGPGLALAQIPRVEPAIPSYQRTSGVSGTVNSVGSDTMNNLMTLWGETFAKMYPNLKIQVEGKGSSTAPPALIAGTAQFGPMSRAMRPSEIDQFEKKYGYKPTQLRTSYDALAVYVNKDNPLDKAGLAQIDGVFSKSRRRGGKNIATWGQLGLTGDWANRPISMYGRNSASGTYGFFKEHVLQNGDYKDTVKEQPGSASVVQGVTEDRFGIGYSGIGYRTSGVKVISLGARDGSYSSGGFQPEGAGRALPGHPAAGGERGRGPAGLPRRELRDRVRLVRYRGAELRLTHKEFELFRYLVERAGRVLTRERLLERVWGYDSEVDLRSIDAHIRRLRQKLGPARQHIETVVGMGYRFVK